MDIVFGIDLGTTYSCVAYVDEFDKPVAIKNIEGELITPSVIYFDSETQQSVGEEAKSYSISDPENAVSFIKREMGTDYKRTIRGQQYNPQMLSAKILVKIVNDANSTLRSQGILTDSDDDVKKVLITCPAYFGMAEKQATKEAGIIAGLDVIDIINEPTAAALYYGTKNGAMEDKRILVYDLGGGTFDVTVMDIVDGQVNVVCTGGDAQLGGKDWDEATVSYLLNLWQEENDSSEDITEDLDTKAAMMAAAEKAKKSLTSKEEAKVNFTHDGEPFRTKISREEFDEYTTGLLQKTIELTDNCLASMEEQDQKHGRGRKVIDEILLVGGSTKMPQVAKKLEEKYGIKVSSWDPDEAVAKGAAIAALTIDKIQADNIESSEGYGDLARTPFINVTSRTYGLYCIDSYTGQGMISNMIIKDDSLPIENEEDYVTHDDNQRGLTLQLFETVAKEDITDPEAIKAAKNVANFDMKFNSSVPKGTGLHVKMILDQSGLLKIQAEEMYGHTALTVDYKIEGSMSAKQLEEARADQKKCITE